MSQQVMNTKGAAKYLGCSETWIHKLVQRDKVKAQVYDNNGILVEHVPKSARQGQGLYFFQSDLDAYHPEVKRRPKGSRDKIEHSPKRKEAMLKRKKDSSKSA
jgi:hypothetical protein